MLPVHEKDYPILSIIVYSIFPKFCMKRILTLRFLGINLKTGFDNIRGLRFFLKDLTSFKRQLGDDKQFPIEEWFPVLNERYAEGGVMSGHYFHQDLLVAKRIFQNKPAKHVDIG